ncbi:MAG: hypothetical protein SGI92_01905, partial [Bryobacteraceae bacterium]|nr:hypothetical protein [Bryobacteraceae bacterium]
PVRPGVPTPGATPVSATPAPAPGIVVTSLPLAGPGGLPDSFASISTPGITPVQIPGLPQSSVVFTPSGSSVGVENSGPSGAGSVSTIGTGITPGNLTSGGDTDQELLPAIGTLVTDTGPVRVADLPGEAMVPEAGSLLLVLTGLAAALAGRRLRRPLLRRVD